MLSCTLFSSFDARNVFKSVLTVYMARDYQPKLAHVMLRPKLSKSLFSNLFVKCYCNAVSGSVQTVEKTFFRDILWKLL